MRAVQMALLVFFLARACHGASGTIPPNARAAALGGILVVGDSASPLKVAGLSARGLTLETSWANPYGIEGLYVTAVSLRERWRSAGLAASLQSLNTPTPYGEVHLRCAVNIVAARRVSIGAGAGLGWLSDSEGVFATEVESCMGLAIGLPGKWELGCAAHTPVSREGPGGENGGAFRWGVGFPLVDGLSVAIEEERCAGVSVRRIGGELKVARGVAVMAGVSSWPLAMSLGLGVTRAGTTLSLAAVQHEVLGPTPYVSVSYGPPGRAAAKAR